MSDLLQKKEPSGDGIQNKGQLSSSERLKKLKQLKSLKNSSKAENRKDLYKEYEKKKIDQKAIEKLAERQERAKEELNEIEFESNRIGEEGKGGINYKRLKNLNYTVEDDEIWNGKIKQNKDKKNEQQEFQNYSQLAEKTYLKKLKKMEILSNDEYKKQKELYENLKSKGRLTESEIISKLTNKTMIDKLVSELKEQDDKAYKKRKIKDNDDDISIGYINDKNKQFNDKLNRHFDKYLTDLQDNIKRGGST